MINTPQQCIDFITSSEFPLPEKFSAFEKPWSEAPYYWSYRSIWPGMNYRIEIAPEEEFVQVRFFGEEDLRDKVWNEFIKPVENGKDFEVVAPGTICIKNESVLEYPFDQKKLLAQYKKLLELFDQMTAIRGF